MTYGKRILVSGLFNIETNVRIRQFPIDYYPIDYNFYGVKSSVAGVGYNVAKALATLSNRVIPISMVGSDFESEYILRELQINNIPTDYIKQVLQNTPTSAILFDSEGKRQIYCDLKDIQESEYDFASIEQDIFSCDAVIATNINFNRRLLPIAKKYNKLIATDVQTLSDLNDEYNQDFLLNADIIFLSNELINCPPKEFLTLIKNNFSAKIIVLGQGAQGAMLYSRKDNAFYQFASVSVGDVKNTVGAGDALFSSFVNYYLKGQNEIEALKRAEIFASHKICFNGAGNGFANEEKIEELYKDIKFFIKQV